ncbi:GPN-loop GTPase 2 [Pteropus alecto]|uniref:GPN-loop GTPase 2 n=1 Tax=Pteropus alecto TaxID=9402 RepID=L5JUC0_PTEAL|nr:GPN-loop GTPase 2 [Pteropus alecto]
MAGAAPTTAFGQAVIGPPGSGKTTYCLGMSEFLRSLGRRVAVVNLDPANEGLPYECAVDVGELVGLGDVMDALCLGPNGGLLYCMEYLEANLDWLRAKLDSLRGHYFLFDCPGQVELCTHHGALRSIFSQMAQWDLRLTAVHLVDSHYCTDPAKFISVLCTSLATMLHIELPHVNLLSKMDLIEHYGKLAFNLDYYTEVLDLSYLLDHLASDPFFRHYRQLNEKLVQLIEDYSLVSFIPLNIQLGSLYTCSFLNVSTDEVRKSPARDLTKARVMSQDSFKDKESIQRVLQAVDKANGYCFGVQEQRSLEAMMSAAMGADFHFSSIAVTDTRIRAATVASVAVVNLPDPDLRPNLTGSISGVIVFPFVNLIFILLSQREVEGTLWLKQKFAVFFELLLDTPSLSTLGIQEKYLAPSDHSVEQETMKL